MKPVKRVLSGSPQCALGTAVVALALAGGCSDPAGPPVATTIEVSPATAVLEDAGATALLIATVRDQHGRIMTDIVVAWSSSDSLIAQVAEKGLVTGGEVGMTTVQASADALRGAATIAVKPGPRAVLHKVYREMGGRGWKNNTRWLTNEPINRWYGVTEDGQGNIWGLQLDQNEMVGTITPELGNLTSLRHLNLTGNALTGPIPPELGNLTNLWELRLGANELTGPIPPELGNLTNLRHLNLTGNELTDPIPPALGSLGNLRMLVLAGNELTGSIPPELGNLQDLQRLYLSTNELTGSVPLELGNLPNLELLYLFGNELTGPLPGDLTGVPLTVFHWHDTGLCAPTDNAFQEWLDSIFNHSGNEDCDSGIQ